MPHPSIEHLRKRRAERSGDQNVLWKELDLIVDLLEVSMEGIAQTEDALAQLKADSEARDAATSQALTDLKAEVAKLEAQGVDTTAVNATISALDAAVKTGTSEAQAADPGAQAAQPTTSSVSVDIGESGEGSATVAQPFAQVSVATGPSAGTAVLSGVEGDPSQTKVTVSGSTPNSTQTVVLAVAAA